MRSRSQSRRGRLARRTVGWLCVVVLLELVARAVVYGLAAATPEVRALGGDFGGPGFLTMLTVALTLGAALGTMLVWSVAIGVRERWELAEERLAGNPPRVPALAVIKRAVVLTLVGWLTFAGIETVIHLRAGYGFHGLECLVGPLHRNALPVIAGLSVIASALAAVATLVLGWMRRTVARLVRPRAALAVAPAQFPFSFVSVARRAPLNACAAPRGPPLVAG